MSDKDTSAAGSFDLDRLKQLIRLMEKHDLTEVKLQRDDQKWVLRRGSSSSDQSRQVTLPAAVPGTAPHMPYPAVAAPMANPTDVSAKKSASDQNLIQITSPTVGTFYASPQPGDPAFVKIGDRVTPETIVCIVEAMKVFNQIPAEVSGTIHKVLVSDGDAVEFGQALFLVTPG